VTVLLSVGLAILMLVRNEKRIIFYL
jgi:hypothetical protein